MSVHRFCFVCLGNICRSPLAEGVFRHLVEERVLGDRFHIESRGTGGWHVGEPPDPRSIEVARRHGIELVSRGKQYSTRDNERFDLFLAMDRSNRDTLIEMGAPEEKVRLYLSFDPALRAGADRAMEVPDPYYGGPDGFDRVYAMILAAGRGLLERYA